ncbi:MAG: LysR family transcriptional regulator [Pseudomonadota bacterium]
MNLRQLEAFRATMRSGSITGAARLMNISQPSVSRLIAELESSIGFVLFIRSGHGLTATIEARKFSQSVESMFVGLNKLEQSAEAIRNADDETITLGAIPALAHCAMPEAVASFSAQRSSTQIRVEIMNTPDIIDAILLQKLDLGVICPSRDYDGIHFIHQTSVQYVCTLPRGHPESGRKKSIDLEALRSNDEVTLTPDPPHHSSTNAEFLSRINSGARFASHSSPAIASIARLTAFPAVVDPFTARVAEALGGVVIKQLKQDLEYPIAIVTRNVDALTTVSAELSERLIEQIRQFPKR